MTTEQYLRPTYAEMAYLSKPDGSVFYTQGKSAVIAAVYGPVEVKLQKEIVDEVSVEVIFRPKQGQSGVIERQRESIIEEAVKSAIITSTYRRMAITIVVQELHDDGGIICCCINAACMALIDAGLPMRFLIVAVPVAIHHGNIILDPNKKNKKSDADVTLVFESQSEQVISIHSQGQYTETQLQNAIAASKQAFKNIISFYRQSVKKKYSKEPQEVAVT